MIIWSHNAYWFQGSPSLWGEERQIPHAVALTALIDLYQSLQPDILCLQEVPSAAVAAELAQQLKMQSHFAAGGERQAYGGAVLWSNGADGQVEDLTHLRNSLDRRFERMCLKLTLETEYSPVTVVNVHLSSNRFAPNREGDPLRLAELEALFGGVDLPDIVAGDFNARQDSSVCSQMRRRGYIDAHRHDEQDIDYVWIHEHANFAVEPMVPVTAFGISGHEPTLLSDHRPVGVEITWS